MDAFLDEAAAYRAAREAQAGHARQIAATRLLCGLDLEAMFNADATTVRTAVARLERAIERERLKGCRSHWSYDLNRHIALKQARDRLKAGWAPAVGQGVAATKNGA